MNMKEEVSMNIEELRKRSQRLHKEATIIDMLESLYPARDVGYFSSLVDAGVAAVHATIPEVRSDLPTAIAEIAAFQKLMEATDVVKPVSQVSDIESAKREGKVAVIGGMQDSIPFERNLDLIRVFHKLGIRVVQLAYSRSNYLGAGCVESQDHGLTDRGREAIRELNRQGILIDVSHCGNRTSREAAEVSSVPIAITHATPSTLVEMPRAKTDDTLKAVAAKGGVVGQAMEYSFCEKRDRMGIPPTIADYVDIIEYLVHLVGIDHVGFGFDNAPFWKKEDYEEFFFISGLGDSLIYPHKSPPFEDFHLVGFNDMSDMIKITEEILRRGYSDDDARKILGENWLRLLKQVWK